MKTATIKSIDGKKEWQGRHGSFLDYSLTLDPGGEGFVLTRKLDSEGGHKAVSVGSELTYEVKSQDQYGTKIREVNSEFQGGGTGTAAGAGLSDAARRESIERQVAAKCAAQVVAAAVATGTLPTEKLAASFDALVNKFHVSIRGFTKDESAANSTAAESLPAADTSGLKTDDDIPF